MKDNSSHSIQKVLVEVNTSSLKTGNYFKNNFLKYLNEIILPLFEEQLNEINIKTGNYDIRLDELSLNIDVNKPEEFATIKNSIVTEATEQITALVSKELLGVSEKEIVIQDVQKNKKEFLKEFLTNGKFPWWFSNNQIDLETINLNDFIRVSELKNNQFRERLINQFEDFQLLILIENALSKVSDSKVKAKLELLFLRVYKEIYFKKSVALTQRTKIWNAILLLFATVNDKTALHKNVIHVLKAIKIITPAFETTLLKTSEETFFKTLAFENILMNASAISEVTFFTKNTTAVFENALTTDTTKRNDNIANLEVHDREFKNALEKETHKIDTKNRDAIFKDQFNKISNEFSEILSELKQIKNKENSIEDKDICTIISSVLKTLFKASSHHNTTINSKKLTDIFENQTIFYVRDIIEVIETILKLKEQNVFTFSPQNRTVFYATTKSLTTLSAKIKHSKSLKKAVYNTKTVQDFKTQTTTILNQFSLLLMPLKSIESQQEIIVDNTIRKTTFTLIKELLNTSSKHHFVTTTCKELETQFNENTTIKVSAIIYVIETILKLKEQDVFDIYYKEKIRFYKILTQVNKLENKLKTSEIFQAFNTYKNLNVIAEEIKLATNVKQKSAKLKDQNINQDQEKTTVNVKRKISELNINKGMYLNNAGLILIHPFLKYFFVNIGMYNEEKKTLTDPIKAAHLLHYIATKQENVFENKMTFEKLLCGIPLDQSINRFVEISQKEKEEVENMLQAMLKNWEKMEHASTDLLRNEFLQREAKLVVKDEQITLKIAYKTQDILLNKLNWNTSIIKLSWLDFIINVEWC